jgi:hypothetical protein
MVKSSKSGLGSTGPRTPQGKARSSRNAVKHGLFSERVSPAEEKEAERLHRDLRKDLHLRGLEDEIFGSNMVLTMLRQRRLDKYTSDEFRKADLQAFRDGFKKFELRWYLPDRVHPDFCVLFLEKVKTNIEKRGLNPQIDVPILRSLFSRDGDKLTFLGKSIIALYEMMNDAGSKADGQSADRNYVELQSRILEGIREAIESERGLAHIEAESDQENALLTDAVADRILRSETAIEGHFLRQFEALERYRRLRRRGSK